jgi:hypothetical protein
MHPLERYNFLPTHLHNQEKRSNHELTLRSQYTIFRQYEHDEDFYAENRGYQKHITPHHDEDIFGSNHHIIEPPLMRKRYEKFLPKKNYNQEKKQEKKMYFIRPARRYAVVLPTTYVLV